MITPEDKELLAKRAFRKYKSFEQLACFQKAFLI